MTLDAAKINNLKPRPLCPEPPGLGELSVSWSPGLRRWIMTGGSGQIRYARRPQGPWMLPDTIFDGNDVLRCADNIAPDGSKRWVGLTHAEDPSRKTGTYAPYQAPSWIRVDRSVRETTIYYTLSLEHPPYNTAVDAVEVARELTHLPARYGSIQLLQRDPRVVLLQNLLIRRPRQRHPVGAHLAHADAVPPAAAEERRADDRAGRVALDVVREQAVAQ